MGYNPSPTPAPCHCCEHIDPYLALANLRDRLDVVEAEIGAAHKWAEAAMDGLSRERRDPSRRLSVDEVLAQHEHQWAVRRRHA